VNHEKANLNPPPAGDAHTATPRFNLSAAARRDRLDYAPIATTAQLSLSKAAFFWGSGFR